MPDTIPDHFQFQFSTNWREKVQQSKARLAPYLEYDHFEGTKKKLDKVGVATSVRITARKGPTLMGDIADEVYWATADEWQVPASTLDEWDETKLGQLVRPDSKYVKAHVSQWARDRDDNAVRVALKPRVSGADGTTTTQLPGHTVIVDAGGNITGITGHTIATAGGLTLDKLIDLASAIDISDIDDEMGEAPRVLVCTQSQIANLLKENKVQSSDYNDIRALVAGKLQVFMGFRFVRNKRLPKFGTTRTIVAWAKGAISVSEKALKIGKMDIRTDLSDALQIRSTWRLGGVREQDEMVATMACTE